MNQERLDREDNKTESGDKVIYKTYKRSTENIKLTVNIDRKNTIEENDDGLDCGVYRKWKKVTELDETTKANRIRKARGNTNIKETIESKRITNELPRVSYLKKIK